MATCSNAVAVGKLFNKSHVSGVPNSPFAPFIPAVVTIDDKNNNVQLIKASRVFSSSRNFTIAVSKKAATAAGRGDGPISPVDNDDEDGVSLGTLKLPGNTDLARFETLLFQVKILQNSRFSN